MAMPVLAASLFLPIVFNVLRRRLLGMGQRWSWEDFFTPPVDAQPALSATPDFLPWVADGLATAERGLMRLRPAVCACGGCGSDRNGDGCARDAGCSEVDIIKEDMRLSLLSPLNVSEASSPPCREVTKEILWADSKNAPDTHGAYELLFESSCESFQTCGLPTSLSSESSPKARLSMLACNKDNSPSPPPLSRGLLCPGKQTPDGCKQTQLQQLGGLGDIRDQEVPTKSPALDDFQVWMADGVASLRQQCVTSYCIIQEVAPRKKGFNRSRVQSRAVKRRKLEKPLPLSQMKEITTELLNPSATTPSVQLAGPVMQFEQMRSTTAVVMSCDMSFDSARFSTGPPTVTCQLHSSKERAEGNELNPLQGAHLEQAVPQDNFSSTGNRQGHFFTADQCDCCSYTTPAEGNPLTYTGEALWMQEQHPNGDVFYPHVELAPTNNIHTLSGYAISPALKCCLPRQAEVELGVCPKEEGCYVVADNAKFVNMEGICDVDQLARSLMMPCSSHVSQGAMPAPIPATRTLTKCAGWTCVDASQGDDVGNDLQDQPGRQVGWEGETRPTKNLGPLFTDQLVRLKENIKGSDVQEKEQLEACELMEVKIDPVTYSETLMCENVIGLDATPVERVTSEEKECLSCGSKLALSFQTPPTSKVLKVQTGPVTNSELLYGEKIASSDTNSTEQDRLVSGSESTFQNHTHSRILETEIGPVLNSEPMFSDNAVRSDTTPVEGIQKSEEQDSLISRSEPTTPFQTPTSPRILKNAAQQSKCVAAEPLEKNTTLPSFQNTPSTILLEEPSEEREQTTVEPLEKNNLPRSRLLEETSAQGRLVSGSESTFQNHTPSRILETEIGPVLNSEPMFSDNTVSSDTTPVEGIQKSEEQDSLISGSEPTTPFQTPTSPRILKNAAQQSKYMAAELLEKNTTLPSFQNTPSTILLEEPSEEREQTTVEPLEKNNLLRSRLLEETSAQQQPVNRVETQRENKAESQLNSLLPRIRKNSRCLGKFALRYLKHIEHQLVCSALPQKLSRDNCDSPQPAVSPCGQRNDSGLTSDAPAWRDRERQQVQEENADWEDDRSEDVGLEADVAEKPAHDVSWTDVQKLADSPASEELQQDVATPLSESSTSSSLLEIFSTNMSVTEAFDQLEVVVENLLGLLSIPDEYSVSDHPFCETMSSNDNEDCSRSDVRSENDCFVCMNMALSFDTGHDLSGDDVLGESISFSNENLASSVDGLYNRVETSGSYLLRENVCSIDENMASSVCGVHDNADCSGSEMQVACCDEENTVSSVCFSGTASLNSNGRGSSMSPDKRKPPLDKK